MRDRLSLDQIRTFVAAAEEGSFSAAARKLGRAQSAVSDLDPPAGGGAWRRAVRPFRARAPADARRKPAAARRPRRRRSRRFPQFPRPRPDGRDRGRSCGRWWTSISRFSPITEAAKDFRLRFPATPLRLYVEVLGAATEPVLDGRASFAVAGGPGPLPPGLSSEPLAGVGMAMVASPDHPLAAVKGVIQRDELAKHVQLVLTERASRPDSREYSVMSPTTWRLADLYAKHAFLLGGLGWGSMPLHAVERDLAEGRLVRLATPEIPASRPRSRRWPPSIARQRRPARPDAG